MGAADRFLFPLSQPSSTTRTRLDVACARHAPQTLAPTATSVLRRCREPVQLSLFASLEPARRTEPSRQAAAVAQTIERRFGAKPVAGTPGANQPPEQ